MRGDVVFCPGSKLERDARRWRRLPERRFARWYEDQPLERPRHPRKGCKPPNYGHTYPPTPCTRAEILAVLAAFPQTKIGRRNRMGTITLWRAGLRVSEGLSLLPEDIDFDNGLVTVRCGKGGKRRLSGIDREALDEIAAYMVQRESWGFGLFEPLFPILEGRTRGGWLGQAYYRTVLHKAARDAGVRKRVAPHQLRHAHACELAREGVDLYIVSKQLGHSNLATTTTYLAGIAPEDVAKATLNRSWS